jgi:D-sedoheptulose 7-phosphate isomerase
MAPDRDESFCVARDHLLASADLKRLVVDRCLESIVAAARLISETFRTRRKLLLCGNGGSAADCQHMAGELVNLLTVEFARPALPAIALTTDTSVLTASSNDFGFDGVFERQVQALGRPGDVLIGISTSGTSPNVIRAVEAARVIQVRTVGLTGPGGRLKELVDIAISVPGDSIQHIQEAHLTIEHVLCHLIERELFEASNRGGTKTDDH